MNSDISGAMSLSPQREQPKRRTLAIDVMLRSRFDVWLF
jgi:hypothetical protein